MFFPLITRLTRITAKKASLILDNIFPNDPLRPSLSGLFLNNISDHLPMFSLLLNTDSSGDNLKIMRIIFTKNYVFVVIPRIQKE